VPEITHLLWIDLETTGTDERADPIIEIGCILTGWDLQQVEPFQDIVVPDPTRFPRWRGRLAANDYVHKMHKDNGLLAEIDQAPSNAGTHAQGVEADVLDLLKRHRVKEHQVMLAGSGVSHFDRRFLKMQMPFLDAYLAYPNLDIGIVRRFLEKVCGMHLPELETGKTHRAYDDIVHHLNEAAAYRNMI
jgi:oligoribonuclease